MNQEAEEQRPIPQTFCGALQKEANCKCLVLSVLIYGCLAAVTWCRCANVTKVVINFLKYPITSTKHVSPCDDGYVYIPVAFMGMLYLVYLVECYHSPIRIDLLHARSQDSILAKLAQLKMAQATIWWKAISYHYVRRKRQITRYRNGDNYTTTQVYYERVNTHAATSFYFYGYCGVKDISKELLLDPKIPITKVSLTKGFAFSNMRSATEFEEARSRFFAEQEHRDDYMEMREGLDLGYNFNPTSLVAVLGKPWFTNAYVYWSLSALLLSWPLRIIIECNTQYTDYQITKLFGVNYDTPTTTNGQPIHASSSQLSAPGSYMLVPSYSEALLMEPAPASLGGTGGAGCHERDAQIVPSYSEALLYERAYDLQGEVTVEHCQEGGSSSASCECPCHTEIAATVQSFLEEGERGERDEVLEVEEAGDGDGVGCREIPDGQIAAENDAAARSCASCASDVESSAIPAQEIVDRITRSDRLIGGGESGTIAGSSDALGACGRPDLGNKKRGAMPRDNSEPNLRTSFSDLFGGSVQAQFGRSTAGQSLENILEHDESVDPDFPPSPSDPDSVSIAEALILEEDRGRDSLPASRGAIPKKIEPLAAPAERPKKIPSSRTYFCIKSILKQHRRRYTLVTPEELQNLVGADQCVSGVPHQACSPHCCGAHWERIDVNSNTLEGGSSTSGPTGSEESLTASFQKRASSRTLIFASPIQEICPSDPFGGRTLVPSENPPDYEDALDLPVLSRLKRSFTERETRSAACAGGGGVRKHHRTFSIEPEYLFSGSRAVERRCQGDGTPYDVVIPVQNSRVLISSHSRYRRAFSEDGAGCCVQDQSEAPDAAGRLLRLTRSLTERTSTSASASSSSSSRRTSDRSLKRNLTGRIEFPRSGSKKTNINMETSL